MENVLKVLKPATYSELTANRAMVSPAARYQHLSPTFLAEAVNRLDAVFGDSCYPGVTARGCD